MVRPSRSLLFFVAVVVLALVAPPVQAAYRYGQYAASTSEAGAFLYAEGIFVNPRNVDAIVATVESLEPYGGGVNTLSQINPSWDNQFAGRLGVGYGWANGNRLVLSAWHFNADQSATGDAPAGGSTYFAIGPPIATSNGYVGAAGSPGYYGIKTEIDASVADFAFVHQYGVSESFTIDWSAGLRYASYEETSTGSYDDASSFSASFGQNSYGASKSNKGEMFGVRLAALGSYRFAKVFSIDAGLGFSFLDGKLTASSSLTPTGSLNAPTTPSSLAAITDDSRSGTIADVQLAVSWWIVGRAVRVWLGWEQQVWDGISTDLVRNFPGTEAPLRDRDSVTFSGYKLGVFVRF